MAPESVDVGAGKPVADAEKVEGTRAGGHGGEEFGEGGRPQARMDGADKQGGLPVESRDVAWRSGIGGGIDKLIEGKPGFGGRNADGLQPVGPG